MSQAPSASRKLAIAVELAIDQCCGRFEESWAAGDVPEIQAAIADSGVVADDADARRALIVELALIDLEYRWRTSPAAASASQSRVEDYTSRWPELLDAEGNVPIELVRQEYRVRRLAGESPGAH